VSILYVTADKEESGKTAVCAAVASDLYKLGKSVSIAKLAVSNKKELQSQDTNLFRNILDNKISVEPLLVSDGNITANSVKEFEKSVKEIIKGKDVLIIEDTSSISSANSAKLSGSVNAATIFVTKYTPTLDINSLSESSKLFEENLLGIIINGLTLYQGMEVENNLIPEIESSNLNLLGIVPEDRRLLGVSVLQIIDALDASASGDEETYSRLVEHFMIGGFSMDSGEAYFNLRGNKAVVIRGDRPDIQMSALKTPTACMILTNGIDPIEYVSHEADLEDVPIISTKFDTNEVLNRLHNLTSDTRFDHISKVDRFSNLIRDNTAVSNLYSSF